MLFKLDLLGIQQIPSAGLQRFVNEDTGKSFGLAHLRDDGGRNDILCSIRLRLKNTPFPMGNHLPESSKTWGALRSSRY
jgi:hypothetical protein